MLELQIVIVAQETSLSLPNINTIIINIEIEKVQWSSINKKQNGLQ